MTEETEKEDVQVQKMILRGEYDKEENTLVFPGLDGSVIADVDFKSDSALVCDLWDSKIDVEATDSGKNIRMSGTLYIGKTPEAKTININYIYQTEEGLIYPDGAGHAYSSDTGGDSMEYEEEYISDENERDFTRIKINVEFVEKPLKINVFQYRNSGEPAGSENVVVTGKDIEVKKASGATWAVIEEQYGDRVKRTVWDYSENDETGYKVLYGKDGKKADSFLINFVK